MTLIRSLVSTVLFLSLISFNTLTGFAQTESNTQTIKPAGAWILSSAQRAGGRGRVSLPKDPLEWARIQGQLTMPTTGQVASPSSPGLNDWRWIEADEQGSFSDRELGRGWLAVEIIRDSAGIWLLDIRGAANVRVNGTPRGGDVYSNGSTEIPIPLEAGKNWLIFSGARGRISAQLTQPTKDVFISPRDSTYPHVIRGERENLWGALMVTNATSQPQTGYRLQVSAPGMKTTITNLPTLLPLSTSKTPFQLQVDPTEIAKLSDNIAQLPVQIELLPPPATTQPHSSTPSVEPERQTVQWEVRNANQPHIRTFVSQIDNSVQYYAVVPPANFGDANARTPGLVLALHGAGVEGSGHAATYAPKPDLFIVAPTNRRAFGFDWEDWGRWDALEVLDQAEARFHTDARRTYLTGHSMGGHGTWHLGTLFPDRFAAIGPSAGWISFSTYAGGNINLGDDPLSQIMKRAIGTSDTLARAGNLKQQGVYILHGDRDDNVPVTQARTMRQALSEFHPDFVYKEQPGAGHWWGNACCDWPPLFRFFDDHQLMPNDQVRSVKFITPNPAASARCHWLTVIAQETMGANSQVDLTFDPTNVTLRGTTDNVNRLAFDTATLMQAEGIAVAATELKIEIDGNELAIASDDWAGGVELKRTDGTWNAANGADGTVEKGPQRGSGFKEAFRHRFILVYGSHGNEGENRWMMERARFDAETYRYRGNASVEVVSDREWLAQNADGNGEPVERDRSVVVYGNATINHVWAALLAESPVKVSRGSWLVTGRVERGDSQAVLMLRPRAGSAIASVAAIGGTDLLAMQSTDRIPIFSAGTGFPDLMLVGPDFLDRGYEAVQMAGYFGNDWRVESGQWYEAATVPSQSESDREPKP